MSGRGVLNSYPYPRSGSRDFVMQRALAYTRAAECYSLNIYIYSVNRGTRS